MSESSHEIRTLRRPGILVRAARICAREFRRERDLKRLLRANRLPGPGRCLPRLLEMEARCEAARGAGDATYSMSRHVETLAALLTEMALLPGDGRRATR